MPPSSNHCKLAVIHPLSTSLLINPTTNSNVTPTSDDPPYAIPAISLPPSTHLQDSMAIAEALEKAHPSPSLHLDSPILAQVGGLLGQIAMPLVPFWMPAVPANLLNPPSAEYFERTRAAKVGKPLAELAKDATPELWASVGGPMGEMAALLKKNDKGPFFMGDTVSYADFVLVSAMRFFGRCDQGYLDKFLAADPAFKAVYEASAKWLERDDH